MWVWVPTTMLARPSQKAPRAALFAGGLGVDVDRLRRTIPPRRVRLQDGLESGERIVVGPLHEDLAKYLGDKHFPAARRVEDAGALAGGGAGVVERAEDPGLGLDAGEHVLLVEGMIAEGQHVGAGLEQRLRMAETDRPTPAVAFSPFTTTKSSRRSRRKAGQPLGEGGPAGAAHHVAEEEDAHGRELAASGAEDKAEPSAKRMPSVCQTYAKPPPDRPRLVKTGAAA